MFGFGLFARRSAMGWSVMWLKFLSSSFSGNDASELDSLDTAENMVSFVAKVWFVRLAKMFVGENHCANLPKFSATTFFKDLPLKSLPIRANCVLIFLKNVFMYFLLSANP
jgi:hypothetical protein